MTNKQSENKPLWVREFGLHYGVPVEVTGHPRLTDMSWHNDVAPSFGITMGETSLRLWVHHVDPKMRDDEGYTRFVVCFDGNDSSCIEFFESDDVNEAIAAWVKTADEWLAKWTVPALVERMKRDILEDIKSGTVPQTVSSFSELHDYVDANCYGDLCAGDAPDFDSNEAFCAWVNEAQGEVDIWIKTRAFVGAL